MVVRGGVIASGPGCNIAYKCQCGAYRWADTAEENGESRCIHCGRKFPAAPVRMPFCRKGPSSTQRGKEAASQADAKGKGKGKAAATSKAKPKPKAQAAKPAGGSRPPWERTTSSATGEPSSGEADEVKLGKPNDEVQKLDALIKVVKHHGDDKRLQELEADRRRALQEKAEKLPPMQRVAHLQKRHKMAGEELRKLIKAQEAMDEEFEALKKKRLEHHERLEDQREAVESLRHAVEQAEMEIPPAEAPLPVGRQVHPGDQGLLKKAVKAITFEALLDEVTYRIAEASGGQAPDVISRRTVQGVDLLASAFQEGTLCRQAAADQEAADRRAAVKLHKELNWKPGDKRGREQRVDENGDETMEEDQQLPEDAPEAPWQTAGPKKGKGRPRNIAQEAANPSATAQPSLGRGRGQPQCERSSGTAAHGSESGTLKPSAKGEGAGSTSHRSPKPGGEGSAGDDEIPYLDSLPSTPRVATQEVEEIPPVGAQDAEELQNAYMAEANARVVRAPAATQPDGDEGGQTSLNPGGRPPLV